MVVRKSPDTVAHRVSPVDKMSPRRGESFQLKLESIKAALSERGLGTAMADGYRAMGELNLALAREDEATLADWPDFDVKTSEADPNGDP